MAISITHTFRFAAKVDHVGVHRFAGAVQVLDEFDDPPLVVEFVAFAVPFIMEDDPHAAIQKSQLLQPLVKACRN